MKAIILILSLVFTTTIFAQSKVAVVKLLRGEVDVLTLGKTTKLKTNDWVTAGAVVKTAEKSFVKLVFIDKSQMNVGPNSEMKIESFSGKDSGVIDLVKGKIRSQVTKDYLQIKDRDQSKLFIKTKNAVMGVRGTDFMISTNGTNTSTVLFEGEIVFNKLENRGEISSSKLESIVDSGVRMYPGEFSVMEANRPMPTVPSLLNVQQKEMLEKNVDFDSDRSPSNASTETSKSVVPEGLSGKVVSNDSGTLNSEIAQVATAPVNSQASSDPNGFIKGDQVKPANGSFVHVDSGIIIPPGPNSVLDTNTNTYIPGQDAGKVAADGSYIPPKNVEITESGKILVAVPDSTGKLVIKEVASPTPVLSPTATTSFTSESLAGTITNPIAPATTTSDVALPTAGLDTRFTPTGGITSVNDPQRLQSEFSSTTIRVREK